MQYSITTAIYEFYIRHKVSEPLNVHYIVVNEYREWNKIEKKKLITRPFKTKEQRENKYPCNSNSKIWAPTFTSKSQTTRYLLECSKHRDKARL